MREVSQGLILRGITANTNIFVQEAGEVLTDLGSRTGKGYVQARMALFTMVLAI
jgi:hypothetical protein